MSSWRYYLTFWWCSLGHVTVNTGHIFTFNLGLLRCSATMMLFCWFLQSNCSQLMETHGEILPQNWWMFGFNLCEKTLVNTSFSLTVRNVTSVLLSVTTIGILLILLYPRELVIWSAWLWLTRSLNDMGLGHAWVISQKAKSFKIYMGKLVHCALGAHVPRPAKPITIIV